MSVTTGLDIFSNRLKASNVDVKSLPTPFQRNQVRTQTRSEKDIRIQCSARGLKEDLKGPSSFNAIKRDFKVGLPKYKSPTRTQNYFRTLTCNIHVT